MASNATITTGPTATGTGTARTAATAATATATTADRAERPLRADAVRNRARILCAAREVFSIRGLEVTLDDIAAQAGLGTGTVYRRFANRESIVEAIFEERIGETLAVLERCLADPDPWNGFVTLVRTVCAEVASDRGMREVMISTSYGLNRVAQVREQLISRMRLLVRRAQESGALRPDADAADVPALFLMIGTIADFAGDLSPRIWERYAQFFIDGLRSDPRRAGWPPADIPAALDEDQMSVAMGSWRPIGARPARDARGGDATGAVAP